MKENISAFTVRFVMPAVIFVCILFCCDVSAESYRALSAQLEVTGTRLSMSGSQSVSWGHWTRFDMAIGRNEARLESGEDNPKALPIMAIGDWDSNATHLTISFAILPIKEDAEGRVVETILQTGTAPGLDSSSLNSVSRWTFDRDIKESVVAFEEGYTLYLDDPLTEDQYKMTLLLEESRKPGMFSSSSDRQTRAALADADFVVQHVIEKDSLYNSKTWVSEWVESTVRKSLDRIVERAVDVVPDPEADLMAEVWKALDAREKVGSERTYQVEFANVIYLDQDDSCYHYAKLTLTDLELTTDNYTIYATLRIGRRTVFGSDQPISNAQNHAGTIMVDEFERRIRLSNGKTKEIQISPSESPWSFPSVAIESFNITAQW